MQDRVPLYPGRVTLTPVAGQENTFDMARADQPTQEGAPLNKATLLKDATAAKFGKDTGAVPDDVLDVLSKSVLEGTYPVVDVYAGQNWEKGTAPNASGSVWQWINVANNILFSLPVSGTTAVMSKDGKTWTALTVPAASGGYMYPRLHHICYLNGAYYLMQTYTSSPHATRIYSSTDLKSWGLISTISSLRNQACGFYYSQSMSKFIIFDIDGNIAMSDDAVTWDVGNLKIDTPYGSGMINMQNNVECCIDGPDGFYLALSNDSAKKIGIFKISANKTEIIWESNAISWSYSYCAFVKFKGKYYVYNTDGVAISADLAEWEFLSKSYSNDSNFVRMMSYSDTSVFCYTTDTCFFSLDGVNFWPTGKPIFSGSLGNIAAVNHVFAMHDQAAPSTINPYYPPDTTFEDEPGLVDVLGNMVNIPLTQIAGAASIEIGTYTGTGGYGSSHSRSLVFAKKPIIVFVFQIEAMTNNYDGGLCILFPSAGKMAIYGTNSFTTSENIFSAQDLIVSASGSNITLKWTPVRDIYVGAMCNKAKKYAYAAFFSEEG